MASADTYERNIATVTSWVEQASGGFLTVTESQATGTTAGISIARADGAVLDGDAVQTFSDHTVNSVRFGLYVPMYGQPLNRRHRTTLGEVRDHVRAMLVRYVADPPMGTYGALNRFERRNRLSVG